ncbi:hypothetical protein MTsPCn5_32000 [Croceitalea sp. MTPC5]|uniref:hypothetical protein n=1 Tax=Croceitalea sp. MTPC5 TaxID=3056565 RepID=UPI002B379ACD|nr:hypothetical protein MTsPCn5_32000 [Croceitalea sp. MTPC5]
MPSDIDMLIDYYQWEIIRVGEAIKENLEQHLYREVEFDERALGHLHKELDTLLELKNPSYPEIKKAKSLIESYERMEKSFEEEKGSEFRRIFYEEYTKPKINEQKRIVENLEKHPIRPSYKETQEIDEALFKLIQKKIKRFFLHLDEESGAQFEVFLQEKSKFKIKFRIINGELSWYKRHSILREMNFTESENKTHLERSFALQNQKDVLPLKGFLASLIIGLKSYFKSAQSIYLELI